MKTTTTETRKKMTALAQKGGAATKKRGRAYYAAIGRLGGMATAREHSGDAKLEKQRLIASRMGGERLRTMIAAGRTILELTGQ